MAIRKLQREVDEWIKDVGVRYFDELTNMAILTEEVGEVARVIARRYGEQSEKESDKQVDLGEELADVMFVVLCLANSTGTDLQRAFEQRMLNKTKRDKNRHHSNPKLKTSIPRVRMMEGQTVEICGSKSVSNRLLILEKLYGNLLIDNLSTSKDTEIIKGALESQSPVIDVQQAGTAMRFLTAYFAVSEGRTVTLTGSDRMKERPIQPLVDALRDLGADIHYTEKEGFPPLKITGKNIEKNYLSIPANISSQFITALMLIGAKLKDGVLITLEGEITSRPYIEMTLSILQEIGIRSTFFDDTIKIYPKENRYRSSLMSYEIESDWSSASYFYSLAAIGRKNVHMKNFRSISLQGDSAVKGIYWKAFGVNTISDDGENKISLYPQSHFKYPEKIVLNMRDCPDIVQTVCVTATALQIPFHLTGLHTLKVKETDRLVALKNELAKLGALTEITENSISLVEFTELPEKIFINTYNDHRMAMSFAPFALLKEIEIENQPVVEKSYPEFWSDFFKVVKERKPKAE